MKEQLLRIDRERGKAIVLQTTVDENGIETSREVEMELPPMKMVEGTIKKVKMGEDGRTIETEQKIYTPVPANNN